MEFTFRRNKNRNRLLMLLCFVCLASACTTSKKICNNPSKSIDCYKHELVKVFHKNWTIHEEIPKSDKKLEAKAYLKILKTGQVETFAFVSKSGNRVFDESIKNTIANCLPFPNLPEGMEFYEVVVIFIPKGVKKF